MIKKSVLVDQAFAKLRNPTTALPEYQIASLVDRAFDPLNGKSQEVRDCWFAEQSAFRFNCQDEGEKSCWGTSFGPYATLKSEDGSEEHRPSLNDLSGEVFEYWRTRAKEESHPTLKARYCDLVWDMSYLITKKRAEIQFAISAIDEYVKATKLPPPENSIHVFRWLDRALYLAISVKRAEKIPVIINRFFEVYDSVANPAQIGTWTFLFDSLYGNRGINLTPDQEEKVIQHLESMLQRCSDHSASNSFNPWGAKEAAERLARHYKRIGQAGDIERVIKTSGQSFEKIATEASPMLASAWLDQTFEKYKNAGLKEDAKRVQLASRTAGEKAQLEMKAVEVPITIPKKAFDDFLDSIATDNLDACIGRIAIAFCPSVDGARETLEDLRKEYKLLASIGTNIFLGGHVVAEVGSIDKDPEGRLIQQLAQSIEIATPLMHAAIEKMLTVFAPEADTLVDALSKGPLIDPDRRSLLVSAVQDYLDKRYIQSIHLMVPQIEHALRRLLKFLGQPTNKTARSVKYGNAMQEKSINEILESEESVKTAMPDEIRYYLLTLLADRRGHHIRHRVAHGLLKSDDFGWPIADRLFHVLMLLSILRGVPKT